MNGTLPWKGRWERANVLTVAYLGATARKLVRQDIYDGPNTDFPGEVDLMSKRWATPATKLSKLSSGKCSNAIIAAQQESR